MLGPTSSSKKPFGLLITYWIVSCSLLLVFHYNHYQIDQEMEVHYHSILIGLLFIVVNLLLTLLLVLSERFVNKKTQFAYRSCFCALFAPAIIVGTWFWLLHHDDYYLWKTDVADYMNAPLSIDSSTKIDYKNQEERLSRALQVAQYYLKDEKFIEKTKGYLIEINKIKESGQSKRSPASKQ